MIVSINQPAYLPWLGYFERIKNSDVHVVLDHVQFEKNSFTNRNRVPGPNGLIWLTVPVQTKGKFGDLPISELRISEDRSWAKKHWRTIESIYRKAPFFAEYAVFLHGVYEREWTHLAALIRELNEYFLQQLNLTTKILYSSEIQGASGSKSDLVLNICKDLGATKYISGALGRDYLEVEEFEKQGIEVEFQNYQHPVYSQNPNAEFQPYLAIIDVLFHHGPKAGEILTSS